MKLPSLVVLERLTVRTIAISLPLLTVGLAAGFVRLREEGKGVRRADGGRARDLARLRRLRRFAPSGRRTAPSSRSLGFAFVIVARLVLAGSHF